MKRINVLNLIIILTVLGATLLVTACGSEPAAPTPASPAPATAPTLSATDQAAAAPAGESSPKLTVEELAEIVTQRTPVPTLTPSLVDDLVKQVADESGLAGKTFLGLRAIDWINLGISVLLVLIGSLLVIPLLFALLNWAVRRTTTQFDDEFLATIGPELRWLVVIVLTRLAVLRLDFWNDWLRILLTDLFFLLALGVLYFIALRLVAFAADRYVRRLRSAADRKRWGPIMVSLKRLGYAFVTIIGLTIAGSHFGLDITLVSTVIIFLVVVVAVGARAAIADAVSGFIILTDRPFQVSDDIFVKELDSWGNVLEIGIRSTRLQTLDNRQVIIPNSQIGRGAGGAGLFSEE